MNQNKFHMTMNCLFLCLFLTIFLDTFYTNEIHIQLFKNYVIYFDGSNLFYEPFDLIEPSSGVDDYDCGLEE